MTNKIKNSTKETDDNLFVLQKSVEADEMTLNSIRKSIENERNKAGILLGFFFLVIINGVYYFEKLPLFLRGVCLVLIILVFVNLLRTICSKKMKDGVITDGNFKEDWNNRKCEFLHFYHRILKDNIEDQKTELTDNSNRIKCSVLFLGIVLLILFLNFNLPMFNKIFDGDDTPMESSVSENAPSDETENENPMKSELIELSED